MKTITTITAAFALIASSALRAEDTVKAAEKPAVESATSVAVKPYPLDTCIVSDEKLGEMGKPVSFVYEGQEFKLCCKDCRKDFDKDPAKFLKRLEEAK